MSTLEAIFSKERDNSLSSGPGHLTSTKRCQLYQWTLLFDIARLMPEISSSKPRSLPRSPRIECQFSNAENLGNVKMLESRRYREKCSEGGQHPSIVKIVDPLHIRK